MCNVLLAWAALQQPYLTKTLSSTPLQNKNNWVHLVIFEPQLKIQLTWSSYKVISFLDFQPFLQGFQSVDEYLSDLMTDIDDPTYYQRLFTPFSDVQVTPLSNDMHIMKFLSSPACNFCPFACQAKMKFEQYWLEIQYVYKVFCAIYKKFLTAIDHINYHPSQHHNASATRVKRSETYNLYGHYQTQTRELTPSEENFLNAFMKAPLTHPYIKISVLMICTTVWLPLLMSDWISVLCHSDEICVCPSKSFILSKCALTSLSGFPENLHFKMWPV